MKRRITILVADDQAYVRELAESYLTEAGYRVLTAQNGQEAFNLVTIGRKRFHVLLTGWRLPLIDGPQLIARLRALRRRQPMILWSPHFLLPLEPTEPKNLPENLGEQCAGATVVFRRRLTTFNLPDFIERLLAS
ncbi:MAG: response regulator [Patescibacteria group bacterium]